MHERLHTLYIVLFCVLMTVPALYGVHLLALAGLSQLRRREVSRSQREAVEMYSAGRADADWPVVTTQIPLYNELTVARRVIEAVARLDYPRDRHEIQVLDDSSDATRELVDRLAGELRQRGHDVRVLRRATREHYKAGALASGLRLARGEYVAIFDADFLPERDFLRRLIPLIDSRPDAACVQARWGHLNAEESWLTEAQSVGIDGHFGAEQPGRAWNGLLFNFNGTAGVWRRSAIDDALVGGWQGDTITEDLDLSYRAQLAGWKLLYCADVVAPAEVPADTNALKAQQCRWATGSIQTARKIVPRVWRSPALSLVQKLEATVHLTQYTVNVFMVLAIVLGRPLLMLIPGDYYAALVAWTWIPCLFAACASWGAYLYGRWALGDGLVGPVRLAKLILLGLGLSINNSVAVLIGLGQRGGEFVRTPKSGSAGAAPAPAARRRMYTALRSRLWLLELGVGLFCLFQWMWFLRRDAYVGGTFLLMYAVGLISLGWASRPPGLFPPPPRPQRAPESEYSHSADIAPEPAIR